MTVVMSEHPGKYHQSEISTNQLPLWSQIVAPGGLQAGWQKVRLNHGCAGGDGQTIDAFERQAPARLTALTAALSSGRYRPGPLRAVLIPKTSGGERRLDIPCVADRIIQTAAALLLGPLIDRELEPESFAYRPGRGVNDAVRAIVRARRDGYRWAARGDVRHCFEEIPHEPLLARLAALCDDARLVDLIALWLECHAPAGIGIPQGSPISPLLCNLHLDCVDEAMHGHGIRLVRYADDFVLLAKSAGAAEAGLERMAALLRQQGLALNPAKTELRDFDQAMRFLGHVFVRGMAWKEITIDDPAALPDAPREEDLAAWRLPPPAEADVENTAGHMRRRVLYLVEPGARLSARNHAFVALAPAASGEVAAPRWQIHANDLARIEIGPGASAGWEALALAAAHDVPVAATDAWGQSQGTWRLAGDPRARRTMAQARWLADPARCDRLATIFAKARVTNQRRTLKKINLQRKDADIAVACVALAAIEKRLARPLPTATARALEGQAGKLYWPAFGRAIDPAFGFSGRRRRRPPPDAINAALGYALALLERDIRAAIDRAGLHPGLGALHAERDNGEALVYDLMEPFRATVSEPMIVAMANRGALRPEMFPVIATMDPEGNVSEVCRIEQVARRAIIRSHESWMAGLIESQRGGGRVGWRDIFVEEAQALAALFEGRADDYKPFRRLY